MADAPVLYPRTTAFTQGNSFFDDANSANKRALIPLQQAIAQPANAVLRCASGLVLPDMHTLDRLSHFPEDLYDLSEDSHLVRFLRSMLGPSGAGQLRTRQLIARFQTSSPNFYDMDGFYGAIFNATRTTREQLAVNGFTATATQDEWESYGAADAIYRERMFRLVRAITLGATVPGIQAVAEAILGVECEIYEVWPVKDANDPTYGVPPGPVPPPPTGGGSSGGGNRTWDAIEQTFVDFSHMESSPDWASIEDGTFTPLGFANVLGFSLPEDEVLGLVQRSWSDVNTTFGTFGGAEVFIGNHLSWTDVEFVTTGSTGTGPTLTAVRSGNNVNLSWTAYPSAIGYVLSDNGEVVYANGPITGNPVVTTYTHAGPVGSNTYQVVPYTAFASGTPTNGAPSNSVTVDMSVSGLTNDEDSRAFFIIRPKKTYDDLYERAADFHAASRVIDVVKPVGTRFRIDETGDGVDPLIPLTIASTDCANNYWEVISKITPRASLVADVASVYPLSAGQLASGVQPYDTREVTLPAMSSTQGTEITYNTEVVQVVAYAMDQAGNITNGRDYESVQYEDGNIVNYTAEKAVLDARHSLAARYANDGVIVAAPYSDTRVAVPTHG